MIGWLLGPIVRRGRDWVVVAPAGVGYLVSCPVRVLAGREVGADIELHTHQVVGDREVSIYGFAEEADLDAFQALTSIQGVGARTAMSLLDRLRPAELVRAARAGDRAALGQAKGVGPKLAARLATELASHPFIRSFPLVEGAPPRAGGDVGKAIDALAALGFRRPEAQEAVDRALSADPDLRDENLVAAALRAWVR